MISDHLDQVKPGEYRGDVLPDIDLETPSIAECTSIAGPDSAALVWMLRRAERSLTIAFDEACRAVGLRDVRDTLVLSVAGDGEHHTQTEIAQIVALDKTTLGAIIDRLEDDGLLVRTSHASNRKVRIPETTAAGHEKLNDANRLGQEAIDELLSELPGEDLTTLRSLLWQIARASPQ
jgi:DNA-binding MarR family transcriptional regulator